MPISTRWAPDLTISAMSRAVVARSGSPAVTKGINAQRFSLLSRENNVSMRFAFMSNRLTAEPRDFVRVFVAAAGEANDQDLAWPQAAGFLERLGHGMTGLERGEDTFLAGGQVVGLERFGVGDGFVTGPADFFPVAVFGADAGIVEARRDRVHVRRLAILVLQDVTVAAVKDAGPALREAGGVFAGLQAPAAGLGPHQSDLGVFDEGGEDPRC